MKQFMVLAAVLPLLLVFVVWFSEEQSFGLKTAAVDDAVYTAREMAKQDGCFSPRVINWLKKELCRKIKGLKAEDIVIDPQTDMGTVYRAGTGRGDGLIYYRICVQIDPPRAGLALLGAGKSDKKSWYVVEGFTPSEKLP